MKSLWTSSCMVAWDLACSCSASMNKCKDMLPIRDLACSHAGNQEEKQEPMSCGCGVMKLLIYDAAPLPLPVPAELNSALSSISCQLYKT